MFANFTSSLVQVKFNHKEFEADMGKILDKAMKIYIETLVKTIVDKKYIPVYSGMAQGALMALGDLVNHHWAITPVTHTTPSGKSVKVTNKSAAGKALSSAYITKNISKERIGRSFKFSTGVRHLVENESKPSTKKLKHPTPWDAFGKAKGVAQQAARDYIFSNIHLKTYIRVNKGRLSSSFKG